MTRSFVVRLAGGLLAATLFALGRPLPAGAVAAVGEPAPEFSLVDTRGETRALADLRGKTVVLEWLNHECPFVRKHYDSGNMQRLQEKHTGRGIVWLSVVSSAPGKQGWVTPEQANELTARKGAKPTAVLLDPAGTVGRLYGAKTTPHMFVIDAKGVVVYAGAIDDRPSTDVDDVPGAHNHVDAALEDLAAGRPVAIPKTNPYGCSVKY